MEDKLYSLRLMTPADQRNVVDFLSRFFFRDEPLNIETGVNLDYINGSRVPELEEYCTKFIPEGNSVLAESATGEVVGIAINGGVCRDDPKDPDECPNEKFKKVLILLEECERQIDIFNKYTSLNKLLDIKILSVDSSWRGKGIGTALINYTRFNSSLIFYSPILGSHFLLVTNVVLRKEDFRIIEGNYLQMPTAQAANKLGFERIHILKYSDFIMEGSERPVFNPPPPHLAVQIYISKLDEVN